MRVIEVVPVRLTDDERRARGIALAWKITALQQARQDKKEQAKAAKEEVDRAEKEVLDLRDVVRSGNEPREIECEEVPDLDRGLMRIVRLDTREEVRSRPLTTPERQELEQARFPFAHEGGKAQAAKATGTDGGEKASARPRRGRKAVEH